MKIQQNHENTAFLGKKPAKTMKMQGKMPPEHLQVAVWIGLTPQSAHLSTVRDCDHVKFDTTLSTWVPHTVSTSGKLGFY